MARVRISRSIAILWTLLGSCLTALAGQAAAPAHAVREREGGAGVTVEDDLKRARIAAARQGHQILVRQIAQIDAAGAKREVRSEHCVIVTFAPAARISARRA